MELRFILRCQDIWKEKSFEQGHPRDEAWSRSGSWNPHKGRYHFFYQVGKHNLTAVKKLNVRHTRIERLHYEDSQGALGIKPKIHKKYQREKGKRLYRNNSWRDANDSGQSREFGILMVEFPSINENRIVAAELP
jgi:hypothetical protein